MISVTHSHPRPRPQPARFGTTRLSCFSPCSGSLSHGRPHRPHGMYYRMRTGCALYWEAPVRQPSCRCRWLKRRRPTSPESLRYKGRPSVASRYRFDSTLAASPPGDHSLVRLAAPVFWTRSMPPKPAGTMGELGKTAPPLEVAWLTISSGVFLSVASELWMTVR